MRKQVVRSRGVWLDKPRQRNQGRGGKENDHGWSLNARKKCNCLDFTYVECCMIPQPQGVRIVRRVAKWSCMASACSERVTFHKREDYETAG